MARFIDSEAQLSGDDGSSDHSSEDEASEGIQNFVVRDSEVEESSSESSEEERRSTRKRRRGRRRLRKGTTNLADGEQSVASLHASPSKKQRRHARNARLISSSSDDEPEGSGGLLANPIGVTEVQQLPLEGVAVPVPGIGDNPGGGGGGGATEAACASVPVAALGDVCTGLLRLCRASAESAGGSANAHWKRVQWKGVALTYARCAFGREEFESELRRLFQPARIAVARELHKDGYPHLHVWLEYEKPIDMRKPWHFDVCVGDKRWHPNIARCYNAAGWLRYCSKGEDQSASAAAAGMPTNDPRAYLASGGGFNPLSLKLGKRKDAWNDHQFSLQWARSAIATPIPWPLIIPRKNGEPYHMGIPRADLKQRSVWICAPPSSGKTRWSQSLLAGCAVYTTRSGDYGFEGYNGESLILYDDRSGVHFDEFSAVLNVWQLKTPVYGKVRYVTQFWPLPPEPGAIRSCMVLSNFTIEEYVPRCWPKGTEPHVIELDIRRMKKRFVQITDPDFTAIVQPESDDEQEQKNNASQFVAD